VVLVTLPRECRHIKQRRIQVKMKPERSSKTLQKRGFAMPTETLNAPPRAKQAPVSTVRVEGNLRPLRESRAPSAPSRSVFAASLLEMNPMGRPRRTADYIFSAIVHLAILALLLIVPLIFTQGLNMGQFMTTFLVAPPPPPPPPAVARVQVQQRPVTITKGAIVSPTVIPKRILMIKEAQPPTDASAGVIGGVPGGVPGGQIGGVLGGILGGIPSAVRPPAPNLRRPVRVGGNIKAPRLISRVEPDYPTIARISRIEGDVIIDSIIDDKGNVVQMHLVSGPALLHGPAMNALSQWRYEPTLLNGEPVPVEFRVVVSFRLTQ